MEGQAAEHFAFEQLRDLTIPPLIREVLERHHTESTIKSAAIIQEATC